MPQNLFQFGDGSPLDRLARDRDLEDVVNLVFGIERQLKFVAIVEMDVGKSTFLTVLDDSLVLDVVLQTTLVKCVGHEGEAVAEYVQIDVGTLATCPVRTLPIKRGRNRTSSRIIRKASSRMSRSVSSRFGPP